MPHCGKALELKKKCKLFNIHKCTNPNCSYYQNSLNSLSNDNLAEYLAKSEKFKLHYIYREFKLDFFKADLYSLPKNASSLQFRKFSPHVMGLCLTYLVNCGLSTRKTRDVMREVHVIKISHAQIANYAATTAYCVKPFVDSFDYKPTNYLAADGYTAYKLAEQQFALHGMHFDVTQVIGLTNDDPIYTEYRWLKQIIERLNRTFKFSYKVTNRLWL